MVGRRPLAVAVGVWVLVTTVLQVLIRLEVLGPVVAWYGFFYASSMVAGLIYWSLGSLVQGRGAWLFRAGAYIEWLSAALGIGCFYIPGLIELVMVPPQLPTAVFDTASALSLLAVILALLVSGVAPRWLAALRVGSLALLFGTAAIELMAWQGTIGPAAYDAASLGVYVAGTLASMAFWVLLAVAMWRRPEGDAFVPGPSTVPQVIALTGIILLIIVAFPIVVVGTVFIFHAFNVELLVNSAVAAIAFVGLWRVGAALDSRYRAIAEAAVADPSERPQVPSDLKDTYGLLLLCMLPYLIYLFIFSLYGVELLVTLTLMLTDALGGMPFLVLAALLLVVAGSVSGVLTGFWRLFVPAKPQGEFRVQLTRAENLRLWELVDRVAADSGTRTVDRLWVSSGANLGVSEEGGLSRALRGKATRSMEIGLTAVHNMSIAELTAILRHEFAHFSNRDTVWGSFTYSLDRSLREAWRTTPGGNPFKAGSITGFIVCLNPAWWVYWMFFRLFFRSTASFSRLRELVADWDAIAYAGGACFASGLTKVVVNEHALETWIRTAKMQNGRVPSVALGVSGLLGSLSTEQLAEMTRAGLAGQPSDAAYDTHPSTAMRLEYAGRAGEATAACASESAVALFDDWNELDERTSQVYLVPKSPAAPPAPAPAPAPARQPRLPEYDEPFTEEA